MLLRLSRSVARQLPSCICKVDYWTAHVEERKQGVLRANRITETHATHFNSRRSRFIIVTLINI